MNGMKVRGVLLDVEGTTSAVSYVYDVMFPFARRNLRAFLAEHGGDAAMDAVKERFAQDTGAASFAEWTAGADDPIAVLREEAVRLMDADVKATGLKQLQGLVWQAGFESGELRSHVFPDVPPALRAWRDAGIDLRVYSSGSVHAQRLFFGHTEAGDLTPLFTGHYDTTTGPKREASSYAAIAADWGVPAGEVLFLSDVTEELGAARAAGMQTALVNRPGNAAPTTADPPHAAVESFAELFLASGD
ncbi:MAG: acireductone synthase [Planctomycetota bacterium]